MGGARRFFLGVVLPSSCPLLREERGKECDKLNGVVVRACCMASAQDGGKLRGPEGLFCRALPSRRGRGQARRRSGKNKKKTACPCGERQLDCDSRAALFSRGCLPRACTAPGASMMGGKRGGACPPRLLAVRGQSLPPAYPLRLTLFERSRHRRRRRLAFGTCTRACIGPRTSAPRGVLAPLDPTSPPPALTQTASPARPHQRSKPPAASTPAWRSRGSP